MGPATGRGRARMGKSGEVKWLTILAPAASYLVFSGPPGTDEICPICAWQDDVSQLRFPLEGGGVNDSSLLAAQRNFASFGASSESFANKVRSASSHDKRDPTASDRGIRHARP